MKFNFISWVKAQNVFGVPVWLTYKGYSTYNSVKGGFMSIGFAIYMWYLAIKQVIPVFQGKISNKQF